MTDNTKILAWKPHFANAIQYFPDKTELEAEFEARVQKLSLHDQQAIHNYLALWEQGKTDAEKIYFSRKIAETIFQRKFAH